MARVTIRTPLPAQGDISAALLAARQSAADQMGIHIVEQHTEPTTPTIIQAGKAVPSPNDSTVDRVLVTQWEWVK